MWGPSAFCSGLCLVLSFLVLLQRGRSRPCRGKVSTTRTPPRNWVYSQSPPSTSTEGPGCATVQPLAVTPFLSQELQEPGGEARGLKSEACFLSSESREIQAVSGVKVRGCPEVNQRLPYPSQQRGAPRRPQFLPLCWPQSLACADRTLGATSLPFSGSQGLASQEERSCEVWRALLKGRPVSGSVIPSRVLVPRALSPSPPRGPWSPSVPLPCTSVSCLTSGVVPVVKMRSSADPRKTFRARRAPGPVEVQLLAAEVGRPHGLGLLPPASCSTLWRPCPRNSE